MSNWSRYKAEWESAMNDAGVYDREARRTLLRFFRKINTLQNMYDRTSWSRVSESDQMYAAHDMARDIERHYYDEYAATVRAAGLVTDGEVNVGDLIA